MARLLRQAPQIQRGGEASVGLRRSGDHRELSKLLFLLVSVFAVDEPLAPRGWDRGRFAEERCARHRGATTLFGRAATAGESVHRLHARDEG